jgi:GNAT superfamily N-acetyltransferase
MPVEGTQIRRATPADLDGMTETLSAAFEHDPLWRWAFSDPADLAAWWRFLIASALRYPWVWISRDYAAVAVWIPPGGTELTEAEEARIEPMLEDMIGDRAADVIELVERFEASHPQDRPHYYLSLLGVHPDHRGKGLGMSLLAENLKLLDEECLPSYLESSNPANNERYERLGYRKVGEFTTPDGERTVSTMWRDVR